MTRPVAEMAPHACHMLTKQPFPKLPLVALLACSALGCSTEESSSVGGAGGTQTAGGTAQGGEAGAAGSAVGSSGTGGVQVNAAGTGGETSGGASASMDAGGPVIPRSQGCINGAGLPDGEATLDVAGMQRVYRLRLPELYDNSKAWPLVLALHPNGSNLDYFDGENNNRPLRALLRDRAVLAIPEALPEGAGHDWRGNLPTELAYFDALITLLKDNLCLDESRIFSMGFSGGASFSGVLGCYREDIRAIAAGGAVIYFEPDECVNAPAAWVTIGEGELVPAREEYRDFWVQTNGCQMDTTPVDPPPCVAYACPDNPVHYCQHPGDHIWPDFATQAAVDFFWQF